MAFLIPRLMESSCEVSERIQLYDRKDATIIMRVVAIVLLQLNNAIGLLIPISY